MVKKILYYGAANLHHQQMSEVDDNIRDLFHKAGIEYEVMEGEKSCVEGLYTFGFRDKAHEEAQEFFRIVNSMDIDAIVSPYGASQNMWEKVYPKQFGLKLNVPFYNVTQFFDKLLEEKKPKLQPLEFKLVVHDGCTLGRKMGIYDAPRRALSKIPQLQLMDLQHPSIGIDGTTAADWSTCPGAWMNMTVPELADEVEINFIQKDVMPLDADAITTNCANALFGIRMGIMKGNFPLKAYFFTDLINMAWRD